MTVDESGLIHVESALEMSSRPNDEAVERLLKEFQLLDAGQKAKLITRAVGVDYASVSIGSNNVEAKVVYQFNNIGPESMAGVLEAIADNLPGLLTDSQE